MKNINVIDFDKTLIPFDSFRLFVLNEIKRFRLSFLLFTILRSLRFISAESYKRSIIRYFGKSTAESFRLESFCQFLMENIDSNVKDIINEKSDSETINILCSASPDFYISIIADRLGWKGYGSLFVGESSFLHLYGNKKKEFIQNKFPDTEFKYNFSISDSKSDLPLLQLFEDSKLLY